MRKEKWSSDAIALSSLRQKVKTAQPREKQESGWSTALGNFRLVLLRLGRKGRAVIFSSPAVV